MVYYIYLRVFIFVIDLLEFPLEFVLELEFVFAFVFRLKFVFVFAFVFVFVLELLPPFEVFKILLSRFRAILKFLVVVCLFILKSLLDFISSPVTVLFLLIGVLFKLDCDLTAESMGGFLLLDVRSLASLSL